MGEAKAKKLQQRQQAMQALALDTPGGRIHVQWDETANASPNAQLAFFAEFLHATGVYESWLNSCPLSYTSPNAPAVTDVLGTWLLAILAGHNRYTHITGLRGDALASQVLGMRKVISEDSLRRALERMDDAQSSAWLKPQLLASVHAALSTPWILDIDTTIKPLYGNQEGAQVSYNPHKPGRPSHALHTYWVGNLRLVLDVVVSPGKEHSAGKALPGLEALMDRFTEHQRPALVRGDCGFGNEPFIAALERRHQPYLFKLRQSTGIKRLLASQFSRLDWCQPGPSDQGWSAIEHTVQLSGWDRARRVVLLRRAIKNDVVFTKKSDPDQQNSATPTPDVPSAQIAGTGTQGQAQQTPAPLAGQQMELLMPDKSLQAWEYVVLVTNSAFPLQQMAQLYRDRADAENGFDELKNQWGWGGFTTQDLARCQTSARAVALVYNWWSWYCRAAKPDARMEAITSRVLLLAGVGRAVKHAGQTTVYLTPMHAAKDTLVQLIVNIRSALSHIKHTAQQLPQTNRWQCFVDYVIARITQPLKAWQAQNPAAAVG
jgi:hypothetical protein